MSLPAIRRRDLPALPQPILLPPLPRRVPPRAIDLEGDALRFYLTGASSDGGTQTDPDASLGNFRSSTEAERVGTMWLHPISNLSLAFASRSNGDAVTGGVQIVSSDELRYSGPSGSAGTVKRLNNGDTVTLTDGNDPSKWVRVTRTDSAAMQGAGTIEFVDQFNNVFGLANAAEAESSAGGNRYRAVMLRAHWMVGPDDTILYLGTLGTSAVSSGAQLGASGAGTITGPADCFLDWPESGWCRIETSANAEREVVYYTSRTDNDLTVPAGGRARLGTSAAAGASDDNLYPVPGIRAGWENPSGGAIQTIADETTAPTGITWTTAIRALDGISWTPTLAEGDLLGLWIHRELIASTTATPEALNLIKIQYQVEGVTYTETLAGMYRVADDDLKVYHLHVGVDAEPDITAAPDETFTSLPHTTTLTLGADTTNYLVVNYQNEYGLRSQSMRTTVIYIKSDNTEGDPNPSAPELLDWRAGEGGTFIAEGVYYYDVDDEDAQADEWLVYFTSNGVDPNPAVDTPTTVAMTKSDGAAYIKHETGAFASGTTGKIILRVNRNADSQESQNSTVSSATADDTGPSAPSGGIFGRGNHEN